MIEMIPTFPKVVLACGAKAACLFGYLWIFKNKKDKLFLSDEFASCLIGSNSGTCRTAIKALEDAFLVSKKQDVSAAVNSYGKTYNRKENVYFINYDSELLEPLDLNNLEKNSRLSNSQLSKIQSSKIQENIKSIISFINNTDLSKINTLKDLYIFLLKIQNRNFQLSKFQLSKIDSREILDKSIRDIFESSQWGDFSRWQGEETQDEQSPDERSTNDSPNELSPIDSPKQITTISDFETLTAYLSRLNLSSQGFEIYRDILPQFTIPLSGTNRAKTPNGLSGNKPQSMKQALDGLMVLQCSYRLQDLFDGLKNPEKKGDTFRQWANFLNLNREQLDQILPMVWSYLDSKTEDHTWLSHFNNKKPSTNWGNLIAYHLNAWAVKQYRLDNNKLTYKSKAQMSDESEQNFYATLNATYNQYAQGADNAEDVNNIPLLNLNVNQKGA